MKRYIPLIMLTPLFTWGASCDTYLLEDEYEKYTKEMYEQMDDLEDDLDPLYVELEEILEDRKEVEALGPHGVGTPTEREARYQKALDYFDDTSGLNDLNDEIDEIKSQIDEIDLDMESTCSGEIEEIDFSSFNGSDSKFEVVVEFADKVEEEFTLTGIHDEDELVEETRDKIENLFKLDYDEKEIKSKIDWQDVSFNDEDKEEKTDRESDESDGDEDKEEFEFEGKKYNKDELTEIILDIFRTLLLERLLSQI